MRVLVIHDRAELAAAIIQIIEEVAAPTAPIDVADNVFAAKTYMKDRWYDLAIVDLTLPVMPGLEETRLEYAEALLKDAFAGDELKTPADIIGISVDGDAIAGIRTSIGQHILALLNEDPEGRWRDLLKDKVRYVLNSRRGRLLAANTCHELDVLILTALDKEAVPYQEMLGLTPSDEVRGGRNFSFTASDGHTKRGMLLSAGKSGQVPTASAAQAAISQLRPRLAIMTGFCGGLKERVKLGQVAVFSSAAAWDYGKWEESKTGAPVFRARPDALNVPVRGMADVIRALVGQAYKFDNQIIGQISRMVEGYAGPPEVVSVAAGSGSAVVTSETILARIVDLNENIHAIDMESYAFYYACLHTSVIRPDFVCIKGVADHCNGEKDSKWHAPCSLLSAHFALDIIRKYYPFTRDAHR